jgi:hypothetical protein
MPRTAPHRKKKPSVRPLASTAASCPSPSQRCQRTDSAITPGLRVPVRAWDRLWLTDNAPYDPGMSFLGLDLLQWTALAAIAGFLLAASAIATIIVTVYVARTDRRRDDTRREQDRKWDSERRKEDRENDAELRRQSDEKWERRRRDEQHQREDDDAQQQVVIEFQPGSPLSQAQRVVTAADGITHEIVVTSSAAYPVKQVDARIVHHTNSGLDIVPPGWSFGSATIQNGQVRRHCWAHVPTRLRTPAPIVRFTDRAGNLYYSYLGHARRFPQNTSWEKAAADLDAWIRTGPKPNDAAI